MVRGEFQGLQQGERSRHIHAAGGVMANCEKEGNALMQTKKQLETRQYPQSWGNLALADESLDLLQIPKAKTRSPRLSVVQDITEEEVDALALTTGIINGIRLSLMLWSLIGVIILLIGKLLTF
jgi:acetyl-CoA carboxylase beta subunit